jgi:trans-aconitate 2-methyltransferase
MSTTVWDPEQYLRYGDERARAFADLLARVPVSEARRVVDLGCGPGNLTARLAERWPDARVVGVDSSPAMIDRARVVAAGRADGPGALSFQLGDVRTWRPAEPVDVLLSNATFQWVPDHLRLLPDLVAALRPGGVLAFQVPGNFNEPSHRTLAELAVSPRWRARVGQVPRAAPVHEPADYLDLLAGLGCRVDAWETTYLHVLTGPDAVLDWVRGTALRPYLSLLPGERATEFLAEYGSLLRAAYPARPYGTVLPFRRIFVVASAPTAGGAARS